MSDDSCFVKYQDKKQPSTFNLVDPNLWPSVYIAEIFFNKVNRWWKSSYGNRTDQLKLIKIKQTETLRTHLYFTSNINVRQLLLLARLK